MSFGAESSALALARSRTDEFQRRNQAAENSTRFATNSFVHTTTGVGDILVPTPIMFDCAFIEEPVFTSGVVIVKTPDLTHYRYPIANGGVYRWVKKPQYPGRAPSGTAKEDTTPQFYLGAYLYFVVQSDPIHMPRHNGSNLAALQQQLASLTPATPAYTNMQLNIKEAQEAIYLTAHPAKMTLKHHLVFQGVAQKKLSVTDDLSKDTRVSPA